MATRSPLDLAPSQPGDPDHAERFDMGVFWDRQSDFGAYLKRIRERKGWTTRVAASHFGVSQAYITKLEHHERRRPPSTDLVKRVADVYGVDVREAMHEAGYRYEIPAVLDLQIGVDDAFRRLLGDERLTPAGYAPDDERFYAPLVKQHIVDLAVNVAKAVRDGLDLEALLRGRGAP